MTDITRVAGGAQVSNLARASADQITIIGDGSSESPLQAGIGNPFFLAEFPSGRFDNAQIGGSVAIRPGSDQPAVGIARVENAVAAESGDAHVVGLIVSIEGTSPIAVTIQTSGQLVLSEDQWDAITGGSGGLTPSAPYFLDVVIAHLTKTPPSAPTTSVAQVGIAMNSTTLLLSLPAVPVVNV